MILYEMGGNILLKLHAQYIPGGFEKFTKITLKLQRFQKH